MNTVLDGTAPWLWFPESANYKDRELRLVLVEGSVAEDAQSIELLPGAAMEGLRPVGISTDARKVVVHFEDVQLFQVLEEVAHIAHPGEAREHGIVARHHNSALLQWVREFTKLAEIVPGELLHYSVETAEDVYHVLTRVHPKISSVAA